MIAIPPPILPQAPATAPTSGPVPVVDPPDWVGQVGDGTILQGIVQSRDPSGVATVRVPQGLVAFLAPATAQAGTPVTLSLSGGASQQPLAQLLTIGRAPPTPSFANEPAVTLPPPAAALPPPLPGAAVVATLVRADLPLPTPATQPAVPGALVPPPQPAGTAPPATAPAGPIPPLPAPAAASSPAASPPAVDAPAPAAAPVATTPVAPQGTGAPSSALPAATAPTASAPLQVAPPQAAAPPTSTVTPQPTVPVLPAATTPVIAPGAAPPVAPAPILASAPASATVTAPVAAPPPEPGDGAARTTSQASPSNQTRIATEVQRASPQVAPAAASATLATPLAASAATALLNAQPGDQVAMRIVSILPGNTPVPAAAPPGTFPATVMGIASGGQPILAAGEALITLNVAAPPVGTTLLLAPFAAAQASTSPAAAPRAPFPDYPSLVALMDAAEQAGPAVQAAITAGLPRTGPMLAASMMMFVSAATRGDIKALIGDEPRAAIERSGKGGAIKSLAKEMAEGAREAQNSESDWHGITIPLLGQGAIEPIKLWMHRVQDGEGKSKSKGGESGNRFLIDITLTRLGPIQIDGFAKPDRLDLVVRTAKPLAPELRGSIERFYAGTIAARGLIGMMVFQVAPPIVPQSAPPPRRRAGMYV